MHPRFKSLHQRKQLRQKQVQNSSQGRERSVNKPQLSIRSFGQAKAWESPEVLTKPVDTGVERFPD